MENEAVDTHSLVIRNTKLLNQPLLVAERAKGSHEPTIARPALSDIISGRAINVELGIVENVAHALDALGLQILARARLALLVVVQRLQTVADPELQVYLNVEVRVAILLVDPAALLDNLLDFGAAHSGGLLVRRLSGCRRGLGVLFGDNVSIVVPRDYGGR